MNHEMLTRLIFAAGGCQLAVLFASALVPVQLNWKQTFAPLPRLHRQMYWVYGGYVVLSIIALALISLFNAEEIAARSGLARGFCAYVAVFWGIRLSLQAVLDVKPFLTKWWLTAGYHVLTVLFASFTVLYGMLALIPVHE